jgi:DNA-binding LacI/PurR family transcriptional regulator
MIRIKDIADRVGMASSTVSAVLGDRKYCYVSEEKKAKILDAAKVMGYSPNRMSRGMRGLPTNTIGIIGTLFGVP